MNPAQVTAPATILFAVMLVGCATSRAVRAASELVGCPEQSIAEVARPNAQTHSLAEDAPELAWYRGCGSTMACLEEGPCFATHQVASRTGEAPRVSRLPGLTPEETVLHAALTKELAQLEAPGDDGCPVRWVWNPLGERRRLSCEEQSQIAWPPSMELRGRIQTIEARIHPEAPAGCTAEERSQLDLELVVRTTDSVCSLPNAPSVNIETAPPRTPLRTPSH